MRRGCTWALMALLGTRVLGGHAEETISAPDLRVEHTALVLYLPDGRVRRGPELVGAIVHLAAPGGGVTSVKIASVSPDPADPDLLRHDFRIQNAQGEWVAACAPNFDGETFGFPLALPPGHPGYEGAITLTCAGGAVSKCLRFGYKPWAQGPGGEDLSPYHAACVHMIRADYCGDGQPHTRNGTLIDVYDHIGVQQPGTADDPEFAFEAGWTPWGASCVARSRWSEEVTLGNLSRECPQLPTGPQCTPETARERGALLYNRSRTAARIGR